MDIGKGPDYALVNQNEELKRKYLQILLNEKENQLKQLNVRLDHIQNIEVKQIELKKDTLQIEIYQLQQHLQRKSVIEINPEEGR